MMPVPPFVPTQPGHVDILPELLNDARTLLQKRAGRHELPLSLSSSVCYSRTNGAISKHGSELKLSPVEQSLVSSRWNTTDDHHLEGRIRHGTDFCQGAMLYPYLQNSMSWVAPTQSVGCNNWHGPFATPVLPLNRFSSIVETMRHEKSISLQVVPRQQLNSNSLQE